MTPPKSETASMLIESGFQRSLVPHRTRAINPLKDIGGRLLSVEKPSRYLGGEVGAFNKGPAGKDFIIALSFPDLYEIGMSNNAMRILYEGLNRANGVRCERVFAPAPDFEKLLTDLALPLYTLESGIALSDVDVLGFSVGYELAATSILSILASGGVPIHASNRSLHDPIVIAGGPAISNPHFLAPFLDAAYIGEAESSFFDLSEDLACLKNNGADRDALLSRISEESAIWMPARKGLKGKTAARAIYSGFSTSIYGNSRPIPILKTVQDHGTVEIMRGCPNGCRFCHAGYYYRPQRIRAEQLIRADVERLVKEGGHREITLASLSSGDYCGIGPLLKSLNAEWSKHGISFQLPSLKVNSLTLPILEELAEVRKSGLTFAVETPVDAWQRIINKDVSFERTLSILQEARSHGFRQAKFYFMIGLPVPERGEGEVNAILDFFDRLSGKVPFSYNVNVGTFVPKPHTPFQWCSQLGEEQAYSAIQMLRSGLRRYRNVKLSWHSPFVSSLEGVFARGDERVGDLIYDAYSRGARLDAWEERFDRDLWKSVLADSGWNPIAETQKEIALEAQLPWDDVSVRITKNYFKKEYQNAKLGIITSACITKCNSLCGSCSGDEDLIQKNTIASVGGVGNVHEDTLIGDALGEPSEKNSDSVAIGRSSPACTRIIFLFEKKGKAAFFQHLAIIEALDKAFLMLQLPVAYSEGFNPMPKLEISQPLPIGVESSGEVGILYLNDELEQAYRESSEEKLAFLVGAINDRLPEGLKVSDARLFPVSVGRKQHSLGGLSWGAFYKVGGFETHEKALLVRKAIIERIHNLGILGVLVNEPLEHDDLCVSFSLRLPNSSSKDTGLLRIIESVCHDPIPQAMYRIERLSCLFSLSKESSPCGIFEIEF